MSLFTKKSSEVVGLLASINGLTLSSETNSSWIDISGYYGFYADLQAFTIGAAETLDFRIEVAQDASGTNAKTLVAATQLVDADDNVRVRLEGQDRDLLVDPTASAPYTASTLRDFTHIRITVEPSASMAASAQLYGLFPEVAPVSTSTYAEVVTA